MISEWIRQRFASPADLAAPPMPGSASVLSAGGEDFSELYKLLTSQSGNGAGWPQPPTSLPLPAASSWPFPLSAGYPAVGEEEAKGTPSLAPPEGIDTLIQRAGSTFGVEPALIRAVIQAESSYNPNAESRAGAKGLMQLMDQTARSLGVTDSFDPEQNINGGTRFLSFLLAKYRGNVGVALAAYNAGPGRVDRLGVKSDADLAASMDQLPKETRQYVRKVLALKEEF